MIEMIVFYCCVQDSVRIGRRAVNVAAAQCGGDGEDDVLLKRGFEELQGAFTGYTLPYLSRPLIKKILSVCLFMKCESLLLLLLYEHDLYDLCCWL